MTKLEEYQRFCFFLKNHLSDNISAIESKQLLCDYFKSYYQGVRSAYLEILLFLESLECSLEENQE